MQITNEFETALNAIIAGENLFISGSAGTGKSTFLRHLVKTVRKRTVLLAPTGVAALNIGGQTVHSFFKFKPHFIDISLVKGSRAKMYHNIDIIIIDEISMVRADIFAAMDRFLRLTKATDEPFGGIQICVIGDILQLPPVISNDERDFFRNQYKSPFFFDTDSYKESQFKHIEFTQIFRQKDDNYISLLQRLRQGDTGNDIISNLNKRVEKPLSGGVTLCATNAIADRKNLAELHKLEGETHTYNGSFKGEFKLSGRNLPSPEQLFLKVGAQVMFTKNSDKWVNGTIGTVTACTKDSVTVDIAGTQYQVMPTNWESYKYSFNEISGALKLGKVGEYTQIPLILAWGMTIHKSQGKTIDEIHINLGNGAFATGQLYVALSRCPTVEGITLEDNITYRDIRVDARALAFIKGEL